MAWVYSAGPRGGLWHLLWRPSVCVSMRDEGGLMGDEEILHEMSELDCFYINCMSLKKKKKQNIHLIYSINGNPLRNSCL